MTGATGLVGRFVVGDLHARHAEVAALARATSDRGGFETEPGWFEGDLADTNTLSRFVDGADALVHCAHQHVQNKFRGGEGDDPERYWDTNLIGTVRVLEAARVAGVSRVVLLSSRAVFDGYDDPDTLIDDDWAPRPTTHYGALKAATEGLARVYASPHDLCVAVLRPTGVYGVTYPVERTKWLGLARDILEERPVTADRVGTEVHGRDLAVAVWLLLTVPTDEVAGRVFNCSDLVVTRRDLIARLGERLSKEAPLPSPAAPLRNVMQCTGLRNLGWSPGGEALLDATLDEITALARRSREAPA